MAFVCSLVCERLVPLLGRDAAHSEGQILGIAGVAECVRFGDVSVGVVPVETLVEGLGAVLRGALAQEIGDLLVSRGIGDALGQAHKAIEGDIFDVTRSLGVAFNSTLIALLISIGLMFLLHQLQQMQERYVLDTESYCDENLISHLYTK